MQYQGESLQKKIITTAVKNSHGTKRNYYIAFLASMAIMFSIAEHMIPKPLPWMRIGLANAVTLFSFGMLSPIEVLYMILARVFATSFIIGSFLSVTFYLSISGAVASFVVMFLLYRYLQKYFSLVGISLAGAITSNLVQLTVVNSFFIKGILSLYFVPIVMFFAIFGGTITGLLARFLSENL